jgi:ubiquinone/menaquinone biosynthesis C-methylase UbiE
VTTTLQYDAEASRLIEATYTTPDVVEQRRVVRQVLALRPGERVIDIGTGPGLLAAEMAAEVGPSGLVCGIDVSEAMLALAQRRATAPGAAPVELRQADANQLPYPAASFDVAVSTQVLEYVADVPGALAEIHRVLRPGGRVLALDTDWDSIVWRSGDDERMERVLAAWAEHLVDPHLPRALKGSLERASFEVAPPQVVPLLNVGFDQATYSAGLLGITAKFVVGRKGLTAEEVDAWAADLRGLGAEAFFSLNRYLFVATKPA